MTKYFKHYKQILGNASAYVYNFTTTNKQDIVKMTKTGIFVLTITLLLGMIYLMIEQPITIWQAPLWNGALMPNCTNTTLDQFTKPLTTNIAYWCNP